MKTSDNIKFVLCKKMNFYNKKGLQDHTSIYHRYALKRHEFKQHSKNKTD